MRILLVEDNLLIAMSLQRVLEGWGHAVTAVDSPEAALASVAERRPELVLMDIDLGADRDGVQTMLAIHEAIGFVPNIYLSGLSPAETRRRVSQTRPSGYLEKPVWPEALRALIEDLR